jgi:hypothetical protein
MAKKRRTAAQIRATKKLVAMNKARANGYFYREISNPSRRKTKKQFKAIFGRPQHKTIAGRPGPRGETIADKSRKRRKALARAARISAKRNPRNPLDTSEEAYAGFHGEKPKGAVVVQERSHFHTHVWSIGKLVYLRIQLPPDRREVGLSNIVELEFDYETAKPAFLTANEKRTQMFIDGGDQSVDLKTFGIDTRTAHEKELLGYLKNFGYFTDKKHLGSEGGRAIYKHKVGEEGGELPAVVYRVLDKKLEIVGGSYTIPNEGVRN